MIIVTGASGKLGSATIEQLLTRVPAEQIGVSVRDPEKVAHLAGQGVRVRRGDYADAASLDHAFEGADKVLVISANSLGDEAVKLNSAAIDAAVRAGAGRIFYTSHMGAAADSPFAPMPTHAATEALLADCGVPYTSLRNGFYATTGVMMFGDAAETGELVGPEDGPVAWTTHPDLAAATAELLAGDTVYDGPSPALTAAEAIDLDRMAEIGSEVTGREIRRIVVTDEQFKQRLTGQGVPDGAAAMLLGIFHAAKRGDFAGAGPALGTLIGRAPGSFAKLIARG